MSTISSSISSLYNLLNSTTSSSSDDESDASDSDSTISVTDTVSLSSRLVDLISDVDSDSYTTDYSGLYSVIAMKQNESVIAESLYTYYSEASSETDSDEETTE